MTAQALAADIFRALADPTRLALFERIAAVGELAVGELVAGSRVSQPAVSQHLATLRAVGLVAERRVGRKVLYRAPSGGLQPVAAWLRRHARPPEATADPRNARFASNGSAAITRDAIDLA